MFAIVNVRTPSAVRDADTCAHGSLLDAGGVYAELVPDLLQTADCYRVHAHRPGCR